jgi:phosphorylcholine metabolism protein LicD
MLFFQESMFLTQLQSAKLFIIKFLFPNKEKIQRKIVLVILLYTLVALLYFTKRSCFSFDFSHLRSLTQDLDSPVYKFDPASELKKLLTKKNSYEFSWDHWVNLTDFYATGKPQHFKFNEQLQTPFNSPPSDLSGYSEDFRFMGQYYLANHARTPNKIIYLEKKQTKTFIISEEKDFDKQESIGLSDIYNAIEKNNLLPSYSPLLSASTSLVNKLFLFNDSNSLSLFNLNFSTFASIHEEHYNNPNLKKKKLSGRELEEIYHSRIVSSALATIDMAPKFFHEVWLTLSPYLGLHYDWRFFRQVRPSKDATHTLHHLIRTWSDFTMKEGIISWLAHGALLGWYWNGLTMPWDPDVDVQMPIAELDRLARRYNNTLIIQNPEEGDGRYLLEVSPAYVQRVRGNGFNNIDARFIDIRSGMYIDITGLAHKSLGEPETIGCKAPHWYNQNYLFPLRLTSFEGAPVFVPNNIHEVLIDEYHDYQNPNYSTHTFSQDLRLWVDNKICENFTNAELKYTNETDSSELTLYGACDDEQIFEQYQTTKELTERRFKELEYIKNHSELKIYDGLPLIEFMAKERKNFSQFVEPHPPIYPSPRYIPTLP